MKRLSTQSPQFQQELQALLAFETAQDPKIDQIVADICADVQRRGDAAVLEYTNRFDGTQGSKSRRWIAWGFTFPAARRRIPAA